LVLSRLDYAGAQNYGAADFKAGQKGFYLAVSAFNSGA